MKNLYFALTVVMALSFSAISERSLAQTAPQTYRCGNVYQDKPCGTGGKTVRTVDNKAVAAAPPTKPPLAPGERAALSVPPGKNVANVANPNSDEGSPAQCNRLRREARNLASVPKSADID